MKIEFIMIEPG